MLRGLTSEQLAAWVEDQPLAAELPEDRGAECHEEQTEIEPRELELSMSRSRRLKKALSRTAESPSAVRPAGPQEDSRRRDAAATTPTATRSWTESLKVSDVFVAGRRPRITYVPRAELRLEPQLQEYLDDRGTILSVSGPTKSGKTTLIRSVAEDAVWLSGGSIASIDDFWHYVVDGLRLATERKESRSSGDSSARWHTGGANLGVGKYEHRATNGTTSSYETEQKWSRNEAAVAREALSGGLHLLVVDDFHYVDPQVQLAIVRGLKDLVYDGLGVILASVPHRAFDAVRVEKEMTGRVTHLTIRAWEADELWTIARSGFEALNLLDLEERLGQRIAKESFRSPHLMQLFCKALCRTNGVTVGQREPVNLEAPPDWAAFFRQQAEDTSKTAFDLLAKGPRQRSDRIQRRLTDGREVDIYGAVLAAIAATGPALEISYESLRGSLRETVSSELPQRHEVTRVLDQMTDIAKNKIDGEPVVEYDEGLSTLHISDPYFAFYLRWGQGH